MHFIFIDIMTPSDRPNGHIKIFNESQKIETKRFFSNIRIWKIIIILNIKKIDWTVKSNNTTKPSTTDRIVSPPQHLPLQPQRVHFSVTKTSFHLVRGLKETRKWRRLKRSEITWPSGRCIRRKLPRTSDCSSPSRKKRTAFWFRAWKC